MGISLKFGRYYFVLIYFILFGLAVYLWHEREKIENDAYSLRSRNNQNLPCSIERMKSLLFMVPSYSLEQFSSLQVVMDSVRDICNSGWNVTVHLQLANELNYTDERFADMKNRMYCWKSQAYIPMIVEKYSKIGFGLNVKHRRFLQQNIMNYDYFSFAEEDMILSPSLLNAYIAGEEALKRSFPKTHFHYVIGFLRYEQSILGTDRVTWEYMPDKIHVVDLRGSLGKVVVTNNLNQAIYVFSREHLLDLEDRCEFLSKPGQNGFYKELRRVLNQRWQYLSVGVSEWSSSFQQVLQCGLRRVIPMEHFQLYMIHHSTNKAQKRRLRKELLNTTMLTDLLREKAKTPITLAEAYDKIIWEQYNLDLINPQNFTGKAKWAWALPGE